MRAFRFAQIFQDLVEKMQASYHCISISYENFHSYGHSLHSVTSSCFKQQQQQQQQQQQRQIWRRLIIKTGVQKWKNLHSGIQEFSTAAIYLFGEK